ncbi:MAG: PTS sugar transporter subunit IIC [Hungatella sp.]|nr:PTS sugar transporter subunit IIC [Hungatella sp.]
MKNWSEKMSEALMPVAQKISGNRYLSAVKEGFFGAMPILIVGSLFLLFTSLPFEGYSDFMARVFSDKWMDFFYLPYQVSYKLMALFVVVGIAKSLAEYYHIDAKAAITLSFVAIFILTPVIVTEDNIKGLPLDNLSASGLLLCILAACLAVEILRYCLQKGWTIKMPDSVPENIAKSFASVIPAFFVFLIFNIIRLAFSLTPFGNAQTFLFQTLQKPLQALGSTLPATIIVLAVESVIWCFGIHGSSIVSSVMNPIWYSLSAENAAAFEAGAAMTNVVNYQFIAHFVKIGGVAATLGLAIACLLSSKSNQYKALGKLAIIPSIFNINEPLIFGMPIVLNPVMMIPFVIANIAVGTVTYLAIASGLCPMINGLNLPYTTPVVISGFILCGWRGAVLQVALLLISIGIYYPFFRVMDKQAYETEQSDN